MIAAVNAGSRSIMNVKGISWVGVKTGRFDEMVRFLEQVIGLHAMGVRTREFAGMVNAPKICE